MKTTLTLLVALILSPLAVLAGEVPAHEQRGECEPATEAGKRHIESSQVTEAISKISQYMTPDPFLPICRAPRTPCGLPAAGDLAPLGSARNFSRRVVFFFRAYSLCAKLV